MVTQSEFRNLALTKKLEDDALYLTKSEVDYKLEITNLYDQLITTNEERDRVLCELEALEEEAKADATITAILEAEIQELKVKAEPMQKKLSNCLKLISSIQLTSEGK